ncbi:hypothetical protein [Alteribacter keqinensis]|uniref:Uncharacterized protein n=1 Tax=Alteribacter keqinensis TaxID=2483800 RepID=A0A3M7TX86_9BACI|nr:hypothetical protein [Alteribacter keqinensis]RNA70113.1 hypothetical protein EBO34_09350 [Alteribacter keqinensis]
MEKVLFLEERKRNMAERLPAGLQVSSESTIVYAEEDKLVEGLDRLSKGLFTLLICLGGPYFLFVLIEAFLRLP